MRVFLRSTSAVALLATLGACDLTGPDNCTTQAVAGVRVEVVNAQTGTPVTQGLEGSLREGDYQEVLESFDNVLTGAWERAGRYTLRITAGGFEPLEVPGLRVSRNDCHVNTLAIRAELDPVVAALHLRVAAR